SPGRSTRPRTRRRWPGWSCATRPTCRRRTPSTPPVRASASTPCRNRSTTPPRRRKRSPHSPRSRTTHPSRPPPAPPSAYVALAPGTRVGLGPAGPSPGSATAELRAAADVLAVSGDLGRPDHPLLRPPDAPPTAGTIVVESTYGQRPRPHTGLDRFAQAVGAP